jgi:hypothetical protein
LGAGAPRAPPAAEGGAAAPKIEALFPHLDVEIYYMHLTGILEQLSRTNPA